MAVSFFIFILIKLLDSFSIFKQFISYVYILLSYQHIHIEKKPVAFTESILSKCEPVGLY